MTFFANLLFNSSVRHSLQSDFIIHIFNSQRDQKPSVSSSPKSSCLRKLILHPPQMLIYYICRLKPRSILYILCTLKTYYLCNVKNRWSAVKAATD